VRSPCHWDCTTPGNRLNLLRVEPDQFKERSCLLLRHHIKLCAENILTDPVVMQSGCPLAKPNIAAHHRSMGILTAEITLVEPLTMQNN
jgi:hypothetical protein